MKCRVWECWSIQNADAWQVWNLTLTLVSESLSLCPKTIVTRLDFNRCCCCCRSDPSKLMIITTFFIFSSWMIYLCNDRELLQFAFYFFLHLKLWCNTEEDVCVLRTWDCKWGNSKTYGSRGATGRKLPLSHESSLPWVCVCVLTFGLENVSTLTRLQL